MQLIYYGGSYPFVQTGDVKSSGGRINSFRQTYSEEGLAQSRLWPAGTMCITIAANIAETGVLSFPACFPDSVIGFIADKSKCNVYFIEYVFRLLRRLIQAQASGSVQDNINLQTLERLRFPIPNLDEQNRIAAILCRLDDKIELNTQTSQTLEQIAQAIFKSWFVDFEPVRAKMAVLEAGGTAEQAELAAMSVISGKDEAALKQLQAEQPEADAHGSANVAGGRMPGATYAELAQTAALFPSAMEESELGEIPEGWRVALSGEELDVRDGTHDSPKKSETGYPLVTSKHITSGTLMLRDTYLISGEDYEKVNVRSQVNPGDILLTMIGTVGIPYLVMQPEVGFAIKNVGLFKTSERNEIRSYFYLLLKSQGMRNYLDARMAGTTQKYLSLKVLRNIEFILPECGVLIAFNKIADNLMKECFESLMENERLESIRDTLLPKLLSGDLPITNTEVAS